MSVTYTGAIWNADNHRDPARVGGEIAGLAELADLVLIVEAATRGYRWQTRRKLARRRYRGGVSRPSHRVYGGHGSTSRRDSLLLVRRGIPTGFKRIHSLRTGGWERAPRNRKGNGLHPGRHMVSVRVGPSRHRFRVGVPHLPPGPHDAPKSYPLRARAHRRGLATLTRIVGRWSRSRHLAGWLLGGDLNAFKGRPDMEAFLAELDAVAKGRGIGYPIVGGDVQLRNVRRIEYGTGDHGHAVLFDVVIP